MSRRHLRGSRKIAKSKNMRREHRKVLIATEGVSTEPQYFEGLAAVLRARAVRVVRVRPVGVGRDPLRVVREAVRRRDAEEKGGDPFDAVWCVVDVDEHAGLERACAEAGRSDIGMAVSSPCFEIWLLWHFESRTSWVDAATISRLLQKHGFSGKHMPEGFPYEKYPDAMARAVACGDAVAVHAPPNPHSSIPALIGALLDAYGHGA